MKQIQENIIQYLNTTYHPDSMILYGSFSNGTANEYSDFDVLLICDSPVRSHDDSVIAGVRLDAYFYTPEQTKNLMPKDILQIYDGIIMFDKNDMAANLQKMVREYVDQYEYPSSYEVADNISWCRKMQKRTLEDDAEGYYRWHWLLTDSLSVYCDVQKWFYFGPKKTLRRMHKEDPTGYGFYALALRYMEPEELDSWILYLEILFSKRKSSEIVQEAEKVLNLSKAQMDRKPASKEPSAEQSFQIYWMQIHTDLRSLDRYEYIDDQFEIEEIWELVNEIIGTVYLNELSDNFKKQILEEIISNYFYNDYGVYDPMHDLIYKICCTDKEKLTLAQILESYNQKTEAAAVYKELGCCDDCIRCMKTELKKSPKEYLDLIGYCESVGRHEEAVRTAEQAYQKSRGRGMTDIMMILLKEAVVKNDKEMQKKLLRSAKCRSYVDAAVLQDYVEEHPAGTL